MNGICNIKRTEQQTGGDGRLQGIDDACPRLVYGPSGYIVRQCCILQALYKGGPGEKNLQRVSIVEIMLSRGLQDSLGDADEGCDGENGVCQCEASRVVDGGSVAGIQERHGTLMDHKQAIQ